MKTADEITVKMPDGWERKDIFEAVYLNQYGYYELREKTAKEERDDNFREQYFQNYSGATYAKEYPEEELAFIQSKIEERAYIIEQNLGENGMPQAHRYSVLDIGCGEGFLLKHFYQKGVTVKGIDIGNYALGAFHPELLPFFEQGDMESLLPKMASHGEKYDVINIDRVLDMVDDPGRCLELIKGIMKENSILVIKVANNYSFLQQMLMRSGELKQEYWLDAPDHTGYFNREGMINLLEAYGFECMDFYGDTFVDFNLLNPLTNYYERPETGKAAHNMAVRLETLLHEISVEGTVEIYRILGKMGFGREIAGVFRLAG